MKNILNSFVKIAENEGITITSLEAKIGASKGVLSRAIAKDTDIQSKWISRLVENYPQYNVEWILTGQGDMLNNTDDEGQFKYIKSDQRYVPVLEPEVVGGHGNNAFSFSEQDVTDYYVIPDFDKRNVDFIIRLSGHSMEPKFLHGDKLACQIIKENSFIEWNKPHIIATRDRGIILKRIRKSENEDMLLMVSEDSNYAPFEVSKEEITGIAAVVGLIRLD